MLAPRRAEANLNSMEDAMERRNFLKKTAIATGAAAVALAEAPSVIAQPKFQWRISTTWTPALDVLQGAAQKIAKITVEMSGGRGQIPEFMVGERSPPFSRI